MGRQEQPLWKVIAEYQVVAPDRATALLSVREHLAGTEVVRITVEGEVEGKPQSPVDIIL